MRRRLTEFDTAGGFGCNGRMTTRRVLTALAVMAGCTHGPSRPANVGQVRVFGSGQVTFNGAPVSFDALQMELEALSRNSGAMVWYWREDPAGKMSPEVAAIAKRVLQGVVRLRLPIALSTQPDFSDHIDGSGRSVPGPPPTLPK
jgi:hypothetical protein